MAWSPKVNQFCMKWCAAWSRWKMVDGPSWLAGYAARSVPSVPTTAPPAPFRPRTRARVRFSFQSSPRLFCVTHTIVPIPRLQPQRPGFVETPSLWVIERMTARLSSISSRVLHVEREALLEAVGQHECEARPLMRSSYLRPKSPLPGCSILITRAPISSSWRVQDSAAMACSSVTTLMPSRGFCIEVSR